MLGVEKPRIGGDGGRIFFLWIYQAQIVDYPTCNYQTLVATISHHNSHEWGAAIAELYWPRMPRHSFWSAWRC